MKTTKAIMVCTHTQAAAEKARQFTKRRMPCEAMCLTLLPLLIFAPTAEGNDWQSLFDGKTLRGWHSPGNSAQGSTQSVDGHLPQRGSHPEPCTTAGAKRAAWENGAAHWEVVKAAIRACDSGPGYLTSERSFKNFPLSLQFNAALATTSGS